MNTTTHYAGMNIHASNTVIQSIDPNGAQIQQWELPTQADQLINWARSYPLLVVDNPRIRSPFRVLANSRSTVAALI